MWVRGGQQVFGVLGVLGVILAGGACQGEPEPSERASGRSSRMAADPSADEQGADGPSPATPIWNEPKDGSRAQGSAPSSCGAVTVKSEPVPVSILIVFDRSQSMGGNKWNACTQGLKAFLGDPRSQGLRASLSFFPSGPLPLSCADDSYSRPTVPLRALPDGTEFAATLDSLRPNLFGSPALPALRGAFAYAKSVSVSTPGVPSKAVVVLVTDGEPNQCLSNVNTVSAAVAAESASIPTYVIGLGNTRSLDAIAAAGGTGRAIIVETSDPSGAATRFQEALGAIRSNTVSCDYSIPPPPPGQSMDYAKVNVTVASAAGSAPLDYDKDCKGTGWHYDTPERPSRIALCPTTCDQVKRDSNVQVSVDIGCVTRGTTGIIPR